MQAAIQPALVSAKDSLAPSLVPETVAELRYSQFAQSEHRKRHGQFFTPPRLAALMADWIAESNPQTIIDPAFGTGMLTRAALARCPNARVIAYEIDDAILADADPGDPDRVEVRRENFLYASYEACDAITMNPPYIRHRELNGYDDARARISVKAGFAIPKSANLYVYFVVKACLQLVAGGRGAFLIPTEWMNANFSTSFKKFLLSDGGLSQIVMFSGCSNIFQDALTTASVLLVEKK